MYTNKNKMNKKIIDIISTVQMPEDSLMMTRECRLHAKITTTVTATIANRIIILDPRNP